MSARGTAPSEEGFYASALRAAERAEFEHARRVEGLDEEVALLRLRLREALSDDPEDVKLLHSAVRLLVQTLLARHRLSPGQADNLGEAAANLLEEFGAVLRETGGEGGGE